MRVKTFFLACSLLLVACSGAPEQDSGTDFVPNDAPPSGPEGETGGEAPTDSEGDGDGEVTEERGEEAPKAKTFVGTLEATPVAAYGGAPHCKYEVTLKAVEINIATKDSGDIESATVKNAVIEQAIKCQYRPHDPTSQSFTLESSAKTENGWHIEFTGDAKNKPATALTADIVKNGDSYDAKLTWQRTDQKAPLDWKVRATVPLAAAVD